MRILPLALALACVPGFALSDEFAPTPCVDALEQLKALKVLVPAYRQLDGGKRHYLDDADRPAEIARLQKLVTASCSTDRTERAAEEAAAERLLRARSPECAVERDKLAAMQKPGSRDPADDIRTQQQLVAAQCPTVAMQGVWLLQMVWARP